jgi:putative ABC transport system permease protein
MTRFFRGWRPMLRIARRDALRTRGRSILVLAMIALPVLAVVALDTLGRTSDVTPREGLPRQLGSADALVTSDGDTFAVDQNADLSWIVAGSAGTLLPRPDAATVSTVLGAGSRVIALTGGELAVRTRGGVSRPTGVELDLRDPMTDGLYDIRAGRMPRTLGEVAISVRFADRGFSVGDRITLDDGRTRRVAGIVESTGTLHQNTVLGLPGSLGVHNSTAHQAWLVSRPGGVDWAAVRQLNAQGLYALSRAVVEHPPPKSQLTVGAVDGSRLGSTQIAILALVVAMAVLEVVLLAGPAFAVGTRRQQRSLALIMATGGERRDVRRAVLAGGLVLGAVAAGVGAVGGVAVAWAARPVVQGFSTNVLGPFELSARDIAAIALCGLVSAVLAAVAPAVLASRQDVVAVLIGRRGSTRTGLRSPLISALLLTGGVGLAVIGARQVAGELTIAVAAVLAVVGMVGLIPLVVAQLGRAARGLPLAVRFAVRDAARHRSRTAPAVAAVAATVAGVVAIGIGGASLTAQHRATYTPRGPMRAAVVQNAAARPADWAAMRAAVAARLPASRVRSVLGLHEFVPVTADPEGPVDSMDIQPADSGASRIAMATTNSLGAYVLVGPAALDTLAVPMTVGQRAKALRTLADGGVVMLLPTDPGVSQATVVKLHAVDRSSDPKPVARWTVPAMVLTPRGTTMPALAIVSEQVTRHAQLPPAVTSLIVDRVTINQHVEDDLSAAMSSVSKTSTVYVERGFQDDSTRIILLLLGSVGALLVLGGTLTATFLALSDARPDFATMSAVGAGPRTRRLVAAAYAGTIGLVGAVLGAAVGFVPGIAVTFPLTSSSWIPKGAAGTDGTVLPDHFVDVPWLLVTGLVLVLPLVTAGIVGLTARSRLPMISRLS